MGGASQKRTARILANRSGFIPVFDIIVVIQRGSPEFPGEARLVTAS